MSNLPPNDTLFFLGRTIINVKAYESKVPSIDTETVGPYTDLALNNTFHIARQRQGKLTYIEDWDRDFLVTAVDLNTPIGTQTLATYPIKMKRPNDAKTQTPVFFMQDPDTKLWSEVDIAATEGETQFLRLHMVKNVLGDGELVRIASILSQKRVKTTEYYYHPDGSLARFVERERATDFTPVEYTVNK